MAVFGLSLMSISFVYEGFSMPAGTPTELTTRDLVLGPIGVLLVLAHPFAMAAISRKQPIMGVATIALLAGVAGFGVGALVLMNFVDATGISWAAVAAVAIPATRRGHLFAFASILVAFLALALAQFDTEFLGLLAAPIAVTTAYFGEKGNPQAPALTGAGDEWGGFVK